MAKLVGKTSLHLILKAHIPILIMPLSFFIIIDPLEVTKYRAPSTSVCWSISQMRKVSRFHHCCGYHFPFKTIYSITFVDACNILISLGCNERYDFVALPVGLLQLLCMNLKRVYANLCFPFAISL
jgi:hypothetical protein